MDPVTVAKKRARARKGVKGDFFRLFCRTRPSRNRQPQRLQGDSRDNAIEFLTLPVTRWKCPLQRKCASRSHTRHVIRCQTRYVTRKAIRCPDKWLGDTVTSSCWWSPPSRSSATSSYFHNLQASPKLRFSCKCSNIYYLVVDPAFDSYKFIYVLSRPNYRLGSYFMSSKAVVMGFIVQVYNW